MCSIPFTHFPFSWRKGSVWELEKNRGAKDDLFGACSSKRGEKYRLPSAIADVLKHFHLQRDSLMYNLFAKFIYWICRTERSLWVTQGVHWGLFCHLVFTEENVHWDKLNGQCFSWYIIGCCEIVTISVKGNSGISAKFWLKTIWEHLSKI